MERSLGFSLTGTKPPLSHSRADFCISSYNVDGLSVKINHTEQRCSEISKLIINEIPDLIFLQEVTGETLGQYTFLFGQQGYSLVSPQSRVLPSYFTVAFSKINGSCKRLDFRDNARSKMGRDILSYEIVINNRSTQFLSSHLESLADGGKIRTAQLEFMLELIDSFAGPAVIAGDLNIRSKEAESLMSKLKKKAKNDQKDFKIFDCWESMGKDEKHKNTWVHPDPTLSYVQARYDRIYCNGKSIKTTEFSLIGKEAMPPPICTTPSDHFGMIARFIIEKNDDAIDKEVSPAIPCNTAEVNVSSSGKIANRAPNSSSVDILKSIDGPKTVTTNKSKAQSPTRAMENLKRKHTDELKLDNDDTADIELLKEKAMRRLKRAAAATKRLLKSEIFEDTTVGKDIPDVAESSKTVRMKDPEALLVKEKKICPDDSVIDLTSDLSPQEKKQH